MMECFLAITLLARLGATVFKSDLSKKSAERLLEEQIYSQVVEELSQGKKRDGLWAKALADSDCEESKAKALYIRYRVQSIIDEMVIDNEEQRKKEEVEANRRRAVERERQNQIDAQRRQEWRSKYKNFLLFIGVLFMPYVFSWFTLQKGYKTSTRILSFSWLAISVWLLYRG